MYLNFPLQNCGERFVYCLLHFSRICFPSSPLNFTVRSSRRERYSHPSERARERERERESERERTLFKYDATNLRRGFVQRRNSLRAPSPRYSPTISVGQVFFDPTIGKRVKMGQNFRFFGQHFSIVRFFSPNFDLKNGNFDLF